MEELHLGTASDGSSEVNGADPWMEELHLGRASAGKHEELHGWLLSVEDGNASL